MLKFGAIHTPNTDAPHLLVGARPKPGAVATSKDWFRDAPADGDMLLNDQLGCCVQVAAHWWVKCMAASKGEILGISHAMIRDDYALAGYDPKDPATDRGTDTSTHMLQWCAEPMLDINNKPWPIWWARVDPLANFAAAMTVGPCLATMLLPDAVVDDMDGWGRPPEGGVGWEPNPVNAHRVLVGKFDGDDLWVNTWGHHPYVHPEFFTKYVARDGFDVPLTRTMVDDPDLNDMGLDLSRLQARVETMLRKS